MHMMLETVNCRPMVATTHQTRPAETPGHKLRGGSKSSFWSGWDGAVETACAVAHYFSTSLYLSIFEARPDTGKPFSVGTAKPL
jgi:hypothetical protein